MKTRNGFVSNSSSSSFMIKKEILDDYQILMIWDHPKLAKNFGLYCNEGDQWSIGENDIYIYGDTWMDNFDMTEYLTEIVGIKPEDIEWNYC